MIFIIVMETLLRTRKYADAHRQPQNFVLVSYYQMNIEQFFESCSTGFWEVCEFVVLNSPRVAIASEER
jgi:hypothetical protein